MSSLWSVEGDSFSCATGTRTIQINTKFSEGSVVYSVPQARKGILEPIAIKYIQINKNNFGKSIVMYIDTFNALWNEYDLCTESEANTIALAYLEKQREMYLYALQHCQI